MHNNRAYHQELMHIQRMANRQRAASTAPGSAPVIKTRRSTMPSWRTAWGCGDGPITDPEKLGPALKQALEVVKTGQPALVDVVCQPR